MDGIIARVAAAGREVFEAEWITLPSAEEIKELVKTTEEQRRMPATYAATDGMVINVE